MHKVGRGEHSRKRKQNCGNEEAQITFSYLQLSKTKAQVEWKEITWGRKTGAGVAEAF